jgi:hypothetical protein
MMRQPSDAAATGVGHRDAPAPLQARDVSLRRFPYPYRAALAVCSDLDETPDARAYVEMVRFLNTTDDTALGPGAGLEVGNSIYFDMPAEQFAYWNTDDRGRASVRALIQSGYIDCLHSFGDLATTRDQAGRALDELARHDCMLKVWIDHAVAPSNFGADIMRGTGDLAGSPAYHADLTHAFGIRYVWRGRVTSVIGQNARRRLRGIASSHHPVSSAVTVAKEMAKGVLGRMPQHRYRPHTANTLVWESRLRSGHAVQEFLRSNPCWAGISRNETADGFGAVVSDRLLDGLETREASTILYTHLGKIRQRPLADSSIRAFHRLAERRAAGRLFVTTTRRLLDYVSLLERVSWTVRSDAGTLTIEVNTGRGDALPLDGLTFFVPDQTPARLSVNGRQVPVKRNAADHTGRPSVSIPWTPLSVPYGIF